MSAANPANPANRATTPQPAAISPTDPAIVEILDDARRRTLLASVHPGIITLCSTADERAYLLRRREGLEIVGPLPRHYWLDEHDCPRCELADPCLDWRPVADPEALAVLDLSPVGTWYAVRHNGAGYVRHVQPYYDALASFLASEEGRRWDEGDQPGPLGRVPALLLYPDGRWDMASDATALPVVLPLGGYAGGGESLRCELDEELQARTWPM